MNENEKWEVGDYFDIPPCKYEYLDHPADIQIHGWGENVIECFEQTAMAMFGYMTDIETVNIQTTWNIECVGRDLESLLYNFLNEFLYYFSAENNMIARKVIITLFNFNDTPINYQDIVLQYINPTNLSENDRGYTIQAKGYGETFNLEKHPQGTEVKAITYSCLQIIPKENKSFTTGLALAI